MEELAQPGNEFASLITSPTLSAVTLAHTVAVYLQRIIAVVSFGFLLLLLYITLFHRQKTVAKKNKKRKGKNMYNTAIMRHLSLFDSEMLPASASLKYLQKLLLLLITVGVN